MPEPKLTPMDKPEKPLMSKDQRRRIQAAKEARSILGASMLVASSAVTAPEVIVLATWLLDGEE